MEWKKETLRSLLKMNKERLIFVFCAGLLLFVLAMPMDQEKQNQTGERDSAVWSDRAEPEKEAPIVNDYESQLELRVRNLLSGTEGVGEVEVMVMMKPQEQTAMFEEEDTETVLGVVISADGGGSAVVKTEICEAMEALFGLPPHKIKVLKRVKKGV